MSDNTADDTMTLVKTKLYELLDALQDGEKSTMRDLTDKVIARTGVKVSIANGIVSLLVHQWAAEGHGEVHRGRAGGIFKGGKKQRIDPRQRCPECNQVVRPIGNKTETE